MTSDAITLSCHTASGGGHSGDVGANQPSPIVGVEPVGEMVGETPKPYAGVIPWSANYTINSGLTTGTITIINSTGANCGSFPLPNLHPGT